MDLLTKEVSGYKKGQVNMVYVLIGLFIVVIVGMALMPSISTAITCAALTGGAGALANLIPLFLIILIILAVVAFYR